MSEERKKWTGISKKIAYFVLIIIVLYFSFKLAIFYIPFVLAFIISLIMEPAIKKLMKKFKLSRKFSSIIIFLIVFGTILGFLSWGIVTLITEATKLSSNFNEYYENISKLILSVINNMKMNLPEQVIQILEITINSLLQNASGYLQQFLGNIIKFFTTIPTIAIYFAVTILALYFICTDKIYMIDEIEHHLPEKWVKELAIKLKEITKTLGGYLKAQLILILISFAISLIRIIYNVFCWIKCRFSIINSIRNRVCRCSANFRIWCSNDTMGYCFRNKWRFSAWTFYNCFTYYNECN